MLERTYAHTPPPTLCKRSSLFTLKPSISISALVTVELSQDSEIAIISGLCSCVNSLIWCRLTRFLRDLAFKLITLNFDLLGTNTLCWSLESLV